MAKWATVTVTGKNGGKVTQTNWDAEHAKKVAKTMRKQQDIKAVQVRRQKTGPW